MKYKNIRKKVIKRLIFSLVIICFLLPSTIQVISEKRFKENSLCYGFIVPLFKCENASFSNQIYCKIQHLINDLLREKIGVYWTTTNLTILTKKINDVNNLEMVFEKGTFIIPFTGNNIKDVKIIAVLCDYNYSCEIKENDFIKIPIYELMEPLNTVFYQLSEVKIAQYKNFLTTCESWYMDIAEKCGFLNFKILNNSVVSKELNNTQYNLVIWPAYDCYYPNYFAALELLIDLYSKRTNTIREFIRTGGGFVGSCYAVAIASYGYSNLSIYYKRKVHNPNSPCIGLLAIVDIVAGNGKTSSYIQERIVNHAHPVTYGVDEITVKGFSVGPTIRYQGEDVDVIAKFHNDSELGGKPSCVSSNFGNGKVVLFSPHYEIRDPDTGYEDKSFGIDNHYNGKKFITNSFYYTTSKNTIELEINQPKSFSFISNIWNITKNLTGYIGAEKDVFGNVIIKINQTINDTHYLTNKCNTAFDLYRQIAQEKKIGFNGSSFYYLRAVDYIKYCLNFSLRYLNDTIKSLDTLEKIYYLFEENDTFIQKIQNFSSELNSNINELQNVFSKCKIVCENHEKLLFRFRNSSILQDLQLMRLNKTGHNIEITVALSFNYLPQIYFNSLKLIRSIWYDFETDLVF